ncbi:hybrid sensor histidine kinase/response regulator [Halosimplex halophilum]|uniref:hybrid sensor histidine kinase/response regulator n=1 Tax=Halosimplex halophilum TaxID=2559572 RepID=UPI00107F5048|nr:PAS domain S-box protein [Halosimplex halophilum]
MEQSIRVLLVDDDRAFTETAAERLAAAAESFDVTAVGRADEALDALDGRRVDCVVSGYRLPERDGLWLLDAVRERDPGLPVILAAPADESVAERALDAGAAEFLRKDEPGQYALLTGRVTAVVERAGDAGDGPTGDATGCDGGGADADGDGTGDAGGGEPDWPRVVVEHMSEGVYVVDGDYRFRFADHRMAEPPAPIADGLAGRRLPVLAETGVLDPADVRRVTEAVDAVVGGEAAERHVEFESPVESPTTAVDLRAVPVDPGGSERFALLTTRDVTERRERERELARYETLVEEVTDIVTVLDETGVIEYQSPAVEHVLGYEPDELVGETAFEHVHPEDRERVVDRFAELVERPGATEGIEFRMRTADGDWRWVESKATNRTGTAFEGYVVTSRDVTGRKRREQRLSALHEATRAFMEAPDRESVAERAVETARDVLDMPVNGLWFYESDADALEPAAITDEAAALLGEAPTYDSGEGLSWEAFRSGEIQVHDDLSAAEGLLNPDTPIRSELILPLGEYGVMNLGATSEQAFDEVDVSLARILANTTEAALARADREEELRRRRRELSRQNDRLEEFASIVSHDLRNPLNVLAGSLEMVDADDDDHLDLCERAVERMEQLVEDILTLTREGERVESTDPVDLERVARTSWATVATGDATLRVAGARVIAADESRLRQLFENLFRNAVEHAGDDATVRVGVLDDEPGFFVADDGPGIPPDRRDRVFESGFSTASGGTGLGLSIVAQTADAHGWDVRVTDADRDGDAGDGSDANQSTDSTGDGADGERPGARFEVVGVDEP